MTEPVVEPADLGLVLGAPVDDERASLLIDLAQELCSTIVDPVPANARSIVLGVAARAYVNPQNVQSETAGPYTASFGTAPSGGLYLTKQDRASLLRIAGRGGAFSIDPTPADAGQGLPPWDQNVTWLDGVPLIEDQRSY